MISDILNSIPGGGSFQVIALLIFFPIFVGILIWSVRANKDYLKKMAALPLEEGGPVERKNGEQ